MGKAKKETVCKKCGQTLDKKAKICPSCGAKVKKPIYKKWWFWVLIILFIGIAGSSNNDDNKDNVTSTDKEEVASVKNEQDTTNEETTPISTEEDTAEEETTEEKPDIELSTDLERAVYDIVKARGAGLTYVATTTPEESSESEESSAGIVSVAIDCKNDEELVNSILSDISDLIKNNDTGEEILLSFGDIDDSSAILAIAAVTSDGNITITSTSSSYNSARNQWIKSQFSAWDGSHRELVKLIKKSLNDEKSYDHIETTYRDIATENDMNEVNSVLESAGYSNRVEIGDLFIQTQFSAKNGFNATIKSTAYGIASYNNNTITLIAIE